MNSLCIYSAVLKRNFFQKEFNIKNSLGNDPMFLLDIYNFGRKISGYKFADELYDLMVIFK